MKMYSCAYMNKNGKIICKAVVLAESKEQAKEKYINALGKIGQAMGGEFVDVLEIDGDIYY